MLPREYVLTASAIGLDPYCSLLDLLNGQVMTMNSRDHALTLKIHRDSRLMYRCSYINYTQGRTEQAC